MRARLSFLGLSIAATCSLVSCGPSIEPLKPMPSSPKFITGNLEPMVVDWQPEQRGDLEISMREGLVVVGYNDRGFRLLKDCHVDGSYEFMGMTRRERVVRLESAEDVRANLPLGGLGIAAKFGGEFEQGATLDIAMVMIGKLRTTWRTVTPNDLKGQCAEASHFVRGATVGAFAVDKGDRTHARAVAEIFGLGAGGGTSRSSLVRIIDGQLSDCERATPDSEKAPSQCGALIRVELLPIASGENDAKAKALAEREPSLVDACPKPLVWLDGKCTEVSRHSSTAVAECNYADAQSCMAACKLSNVKSCVKLAVMLARGEGVAQSPDAAAQLAAKTCEAQDPTGCLLYGDLLVNGQGIARDAAKGARIYAKSCDDGEAEACGRIGTLLLTGQGVTRDTSLAARALSKGCKGGSHGACSDYGLLALGGQGFDKNLPVAASLFKRACNGQNPTGCSNYAYMAEFGQGVPKDVRAALETYTKACELQPSSCTWLGAMYHVGKGVPKDENRAVKLYHAGCNGGDVVACAFVRTYLDPKQAVDRDQVQAYASVWRGTCSSGIERDCSGLGVLALSVGQKEDATKLIARGCQLGDEWGCLLGTLRPKL